MLKCSSERWVCAPQSLSAGTSTTPRLSVSFLISVMGTLLRSTTGFFQRDHSIASAIDTPQAGYIFEDPRLLGILLDERDRFQSVRHVYKVRRLSVPFEGPLDLRNLGAVRKKLAVTGNAVPICVYHHVIRRDHFQAGFGLTYRNILPGFVSSEFRPRESVRYFQRVPVLGRKGQAAHDDR